MLQTVSTRSTRLPVSTLAVLLLSFCGALPVSAQVTITQAPEQIAVEIDGKPFTVFHVGGQDLNRPYLHPLRAASGTIVNRSFPAGQLPGETTDHPHHAGLFYGHGDVNGYNYWAIQNVPTPPSKASATGRSSTSNVPRFSPHPSPDVPQPETESFVRLLPKKLATQSESPSKRRARGSSPTG